MKNPFKFEMAIISSGNNPVQESGDARLKNKAANPIIYSTFKFLHPEQLEENYSIHKNANKRWGKRGDAYLMKLYTEGKSIKQMSQILGRSQTSIVMRLQKLGVEF